jgi:hypothetical protein
LLSISGLDDHISRIERAYIGSTIIPEGMFYDLIDDGETSSNAPPTPNLPAGTDRISGFTIPELYGLLDNHTHGFAYFRNRLVQQKPTRAADIDRLLRDGYLRNY